MIRKTTSVTSPALTSEASLKTLVENRTVYNMDHCELNVFETYRQSSSVPLKFNDLVVTSMLKGKKVMHLFDRPGFDYVPGESVIVPANVAMNIDFPEASKNNPTQCLALAIDHHKISDILRELNEKYPKEGQDNFWKLDRQNFHFRNNEEMAAIMSKIIHICQGASVFKDTLVDLSLQELLVRIIQSQTFKGVEEDYGEMSNPYIFRVITVFRQYLTQKVDVKTIANKVGMSTSTLYRLFKSELGMSPVEFMVLERIKLSKRYLSDKNMYIKTVAYESGFADSNYFNRVFKQYEGITPKQYQQLIHKES